MEEGAGGGGEREAAVGRRGGGREAVGGASRAEWRVGGRGGARGIVALLVLSLVQSSVKLKSPRRMT